MPTPIQLPDNLEKRLDDLAKETGRPKSDYITEAVTEYLEDLEDIYLAEKRIEDLRAGKSETYSLEEVGRELGFLED
ncbi:MAG: ribbon-helix-helix domain-containing protein [Desulfovermiculus sp.]|nr:ribbon-helix-helix domain-containing protein [Desulfovermiculus sp.]